MSTSTPSQVVEMVSNMIVRRVKVNRDRTAVESIDATGRKKYVNESVLATMPVGEGPEEVELAYFKPAPDEYDLSPGRMSAEGLEKALDRRNLKCDPQAQAADNEHDPGFADKHPNGCQWDRDGQVSSFASFDRWCGERGVIVERRAFGWLDDWWFAGRRK